MLNRINKTELDELINNHHKNNGLPIMTNAVFVTRTHLQQFINGLPQDCDAVKICFIRHKTPPPDNRILPAGNNLTQLSLIFVPMKDTNKSTWDSTEATNQNGEMVTLCFCVPGISDNNNTGHCPPASGCPDPPGGS